MRIAENTAEHRALPILHPCDGGCGAHLPEDTHPVGRAPIGVNMGYQLVFMCPACRGKLPKHETKPVTAMETKTYEPGVAVPGGTVVGPAAFEVRPKTTAADFTHHEADAPANPQIIPKARRTYTRRQPPKRR